MILRKTRQKCKVLPASVCLESWNHNQWDVNDQVVLQLLPLFNLYLQLRNLLHQLVVSFLTPRHLQPNTLDRRFLLLLSNQEFPYIKNLSFKVFYNIVYFDETVCAVTHCLQILYFLQDPPVHNLVRVAWIFLIKNCLWRLVWVVFIEDQAPIFDIRALRVIIIVKSSLLILIEFVHKLFVILVLSLSTSSQLFVGRLPSFHRAQTSIQKVIELFDRLLASVQLIFIVVFQIDWVNLLVLFQSLNCCLFCQLSLLHHQFLTCVVCKQSKFNRVNKEFVLGQLFQECIQHHFAFCHKVPFRVPNCLFWRNRRHKKSNPPL